MIEVDEEANELKGQFYSLDDKTIDSFSIEKSINQDTGKSNATADRRCLIDKIIYEVGMQFWSKIYFVYFNTYSRYVYSV